MAVDIKLSSLSAVCQLGPRTHLVTGFLRRWLTTHFSAEATIENPDLRGYLWSSVDSSQLLIESITQWRPAMTEKRPGILISRNDWEIMRWGINDETMGYQPKDGARRFNVGIKGSHTVFCISAKPVEAEILASEVYREFMQFGPIIREELDLHMFRVVQVGKLFRVREAKNNYAVPVTVAYAAQEMWKLIPHLPFLKTVDVSLYVP